MTGFDWLACPHCGQHLVVEDRVAGCGSGHRFDVSRQGYLNLLGRAAGRNADTPDMLSHREAFLAGGHYQPIVDVLVALVAVGRPRRILEVGAGTGHYLAAVLESLPGAEGLAVDVSPAAARRLARVHPRVRAIVADAWAPLPLLAGCVDVVMSVFAPRNANEFARVLAPGGRLVTVTPGPGHLAEARDRFGLMDIQADKTERLERGLAAWFVRGASVPVRFGLDLDERAMSALIGMGPNAMHDHDPVSALAVGVEVTVTEWLVRPVPAC